MSKTPIVCLCAQYDLRQYFGSGFDAYPDFELVTPDQPEAPDQVRFAVAFKPGPDAFDPFPNLELICSVGAGVDGLLRHPKLPKQAHLVRMINPEQAQMMAGFAAWHVIGHHRRMEDYSAFQKKRTWGDAVRPTFPSDYPVAVIGFGKMGLAVARSLREMGYPVTGWASRSRTEDGFDVKSGKAGLEEVLSNAHAVVGVLPLTQSTEGFFNARTFALMRPGSLLVQIGRGGHLIEGDLLAALDAGRPGCAALDVFQTEPLPPESPLWDHPAIFVTPHIASDSTGAALARAVAGSIRSHVSGQVPEGAVDRNRGY